MRVEVRFIATMRVVLIVCGAQPGRVMFLSAVSIGGCNMYLVFGRLLIDRVPCRGTLLRNLVVDPCRGSSSWNRIGNYPRPRSSFISYLIKSRLGSNYFAAQSRGSSQTRRAFFHEKKLVWIQTVVASNGCCNDHLQPPSL